MSLICKTESPFRIWFNDETQYMNDESDSEAADFDDEDSNGKTSDPRKRNCHSLISLL